MNEDYKDNRKREFDTYIDDVYQKANIVLKDYMDIFSTIRTNINEENWDSNDVLLYIEKVEYKHKDMRVYLRSLKGIDIPLGVICQDDYETFMTSVIKLLICKTGTSNSHTLLGFAESCRRCRLKNIEDQKRHILMHTNNTLYALEIIWEDICVSYNKSLILTGNSVL